MRRREFLGAVGGTLGWPLRGRAQPSKNIPRIGFLRLGPTASHATRIEALRTGLRELGYVEGKNIAIEFRWAETVEQLSELAAELVRMKVDIMFATSSTEVGIVQPLTKSIPIVFATHADPIGVGHVMSLSRPGGNITGLSMLTTELAAKALEVFKEVVPQATRFGVLFPQTAPWHVRMLQAAEAVGAK